LDKVQGDNSPARLLPAIIAVVAKVVKKTDNVGEGKYAHLKEPRNLGPGKKTTKAQRKRILEENKKQNGGQYISDKSGQKLNQPTQNVKGKKADMNQAEVDHIVPRSKGGTNHNSNLSVISKKENLEKGNRIVN